MVFKTHHIIILATMRGAIAKNDSNQLGKVAHSFKGSVSLFKVPEITEVALKLEIMGKEERLQKAQQTLSKLESLMNGFIAGLKNILQEKDSCVKVN